MVIRKETELIMQPTAHVTGKAFEGTAHLDWG
jgi:hypothetical protein